MEKLIAGVKNKYSGLNSKHQPIAGDHTFEINTNSLQLTSRICQGFFKRDISEIKDRTNFTNCYLRLERDSGLIRYFRED